MKKIVSISGGGVGGAASTLPVMVLKETHGIQGDIFAGASVGAIVAALLADDYTPEYIHDLMEDHVKPVFELNSFINRNFKLQPRYLNYYLISLLTKHFGGKKMKDLKHPCYITAFQATGPDRVETFGPDCNYKVVDCVAASAAAPTYFPSIFINGVQYSDGGIYCNLPTALALAKEIERTDGKLDDYTAISVVTGGASENRKEKYNPGSYISTAKILGSTFVNANVDGALELTDSLLGDRHLTLRPTLPEFELDEVKAVPRLRDAWKYYMQVMVNDIRVWNSAIYSK